jgi:hypothetical protein
MPTYTRAGVTTAVVAVAVALLVGIALGSGVSGLQNWQPLLAAIVALGGGAFAYYGVLTRLKADWVVREEERIERELPGVIDAIEMITLIYGRPGWFERRADDWNEALEKAGLDVSHGSPTLRDVRNLLPNHTAQICGRYLQGN